MRVSPKIMGLVYGCIGALFTFLAVQYVKLSGWTFFTYLLIALAASDFFISIRFFFIKS